MGNFEGGEIVRLVRQVSHTEVRVGDCGVLWGIYGDAPHIYEACFVMQTGALCDLMFEADDVELIRDVLQTPCAERLIEILDVLERANEYFKAKSDRDR